MEGEGYLSENDHFLGNLTLLLYKGLILIIRVNKEESIAIRQRWPELTITRTCRQKSKRHTYYAVETAGVRKLVDRMRKGEQV